MRPGSLQKQLQMCIRDSYRGKQLEDNKKSLAFALEFNAADKTLNEKDIESLIKKISGQLSKKFKARLRDQ